MFFEDERLPHGLIQIKGKQPTVLSVLKQLNKIYTSESVIPDLTIFADLQLVRSNSKMGIFNGCWKQ